MNFLVKALGQGHSQNKGPRQGNSPASILVMSPTHGLYYPKARGKIYHEQNLCKSQCARVRDILCLLVGVRTLSLLSGYNILPLSGREIDGCKVPSKYTTDFLPVLYIKHSLPIQKLGIWIMTHKW
jgi:hypothetical protein